MVLVPPFLSQVWPFHPAGALALPVRSLAQGSRSLNTRADRGHEPHGIHHETVGSRPAAAAAAPLDSGPGCQPGVRGGEGILAMSWSHGPEAGNKEEGTWWEQPRPGSSSLSQEDSPEAPVGSRSDVST